MPLLTGKVYVIATYENANIGKSEEFTLTHLPKQQQI